MKRSNFVWVGAFFGGLALSVGCGGTSSDDGRPNDGSVGAACSEASECFPNVDHEEIAGEVECLDRVEDGYCTHTCEADADCCGVEGECPNDLRQVCSPFESSDGKMCLLSCEDDDVEADVEGVEPADDPDDFCQKNAGSAFQCRSSGGGSENRKVCMPVDCGIGSDCDEDVDCGDGFVCEADLWGGYCTIRDCETNDDCPGDALCAKNGDGARCVRPCDTNSDCSFCREGDVGACNAEVELIDGSVVSACH